MSPVSKKALAFTKGHFPQDTYGFNSSCWSALKAPSITMLSHYQRRSTFLLRSSCCPVSCGTKRGQSTKSPPPPPAPCVCVLQAWWHPIHRWFHSMANIRGLSGPLGIQLNLAAVYGAYAGPSSQRWSLAFCLGALVFHSSSWLLTGHDSMVE